MGLGGLRQGVITRCLCSETWSVVASSGMDGRVGCLVVVRERNYSVSDAVAVRVLGRAGGCRRLRRWVRAASFEVS